MRESIRQIVLAGGCVCFSYKRSILDWMGDAKITIVRPTGKAINAVHWPHGMDNFYTLDEAIDFYFENILTRRNLALSYLGIRQRGMLAGKEFDDLADKKIKVLIRKYRSKFFALDYPFVEKVL